MIRVDSVQIARLELRHPGITEQIIRFEEALLPACPYCGSADTGRVTVSYIGRVLNISLCTTKCRLVPIGGYLHKYGCNACDGFFD